MKYIRRLLNLPHATDVLINTGGNYLSFAFAGFYTIFLVRVFEPGDFGVLSILLTLSYLLANILSFGMPASIYAHVPELRDDKKKAFDFITSNFLFLTAMSGVSLLILYLFAQPLDEYVLKTGAEWYHFMYALIGTQLFIWQNFIRDVLNAAGRFMHINIAMNVSNFIKAVILVWLAVEGLLGITQVLIVLLIIGPIIVFAVVLIERRWIVSSILKSSASRKNIKVWYTLTYFLSTQLFQLASRADIFFISFYLTRPEVGLYGLSQRIILAVVTSADSITQVMSPQFAKVKTRSGVRNAIKYSFTYMLIPTAMFLLGMFIPGSVYDFVFGGSYADSTGITKALSFAYIPFSFLAAVLLFFLYTVKKPYYLLQINGLFLAVVALGNFILVPRLGLFGPSVTYVIAFAIAGIYTWRCFVKEFRQLPKK